jgi:hypothetical protein
METDLAINDSRQEVDRLLVDSSPYATLSGSLGEKDDSDTPLTWEISPLGLCTENILASREQVRALRPVLELAFHQPGSKAFKSTIMPAWRQ